MKKTLFLLFIYSQVFSQTVNLKGKLFDKETNKPIIYANISLLKTSIGISSLEDGSFSLEIDKKLLEEKVHISCLNYKDTIVLAKYLQNKILYLELKSFKLDEIILSKKRNKKIVLDKVKRRVSPFHTNGIRMVAKYFPNELKFHAFLDKVNIYFSKRNSHKAKFRIRIFSIDEKTGMPEEDILNESIPILLKKGQRSVELNLEKYYLELPKNGLFVVFEKLLIPYNLYEWNHLKKKGYYYAPIIGLTNSKEYKEMNRVYYFSKGSWYKLPTADNDFSTVPAISLTLSN